jgi:ppGpp synthetase/RelA/SpoT-type nucleotidyltranferase
VVVNDRAVDAVLRQVRGVLRERLQTVCADGDPGSRTGLRCAWSVPALAERVGLGSKRMCRFGSVASATYSKTRVNRAGEILRKWYQALPGAEASGLEHEAMMVLLDFRAAIQAPMKKTTVGVRQFVQRESAHPVVVGQRLKRTPQIVMKLARHPEMQLARMQDIGGCRAILGGGASEVQGVLRRIRRNWDVKGFKDYVASPAPSGYRAIHIIVERDGRLVEIQLRTPRQHEWAEAVERTGLRLRIPLKEGVGPADLLEYFRLAAHGLALEELGETVDEAFQAEFAAVQERVKHYFARTPG